MTYWILDGHAPVATDDVQAWGQMFEAADGRTVAKTTLPDRRRVSTVFLGTDYNFSKDGPPLLFETMVFEPDSWNDLDCQRYATWDEAQAGHDALVTLYTELVAGEAT